MDGYWMLIMVDGCTLTCGDILTRECITMTSVLPIPGPLASFLHWYLNGEQPIDLSRERQPFMTSNGSVLLAVCLRDGRSLLQFLPSLYEHVQGLSDTLPVDEEDIGLLRWKWHSLVFHSVCESLVVLYPKLLNRFSPFDGSNPFFNNETNSNAGETSETFP